MKYLVTGFIIFLNFSLVQAMDVLGNRDCGQWGQFQCWAWQKEFWDTTGFGCDRGLKTSWNWKKWRNECAMGTRYTGNANHWISDSLKFQRHLLKDERIYNTPMIDAHNAFQYTKAGIHLLQNQTYSPTDLLYMGVRILSVDVHNYRDNMRMVHCERNMRALCDLRGRYWANYLEELKIWSDRNPGEFIIVRIEDYSEKDLTNFAYPIEAIFGRALVFNQADLNTYGGKMPSLQTIRNLGRRIAFFNQNDSDGGWTIRQSSHFYPGWPSEYVKNFNPNECRHAGYDLFGAQGETQKNERWIGIAESNGKLFGAPFSNAFFDGRKESGSVDVAAVKAAAKCGVTDIQMDWVDNERMAAAIWSWDVGQPRNFGSELNCVKQQNGRWYTANCGESKRFACRNKTNKWDWRVTSASSRFSDGDSKCLSEFGSGFQFDFPNRGDQNEIIRRLTNNGEIWLKYWHGDTETGEVGTFYIIPQISNKALTEAGDSAIQYSYLGSTDQRQKWILDKDGQGFYQIKNKSNGKCLDSFQDGNGGKLGLYNCHGGDNQKWKLISKGNSNLSLQNKRSGRCADINGTKKANLDSLIGWDCYNVIQHYFKLYKL